MSEYEDYLIREATGQTRDFEESHDCPKCELHFSDCICEEEPVEPNDSNETGDALSFEEAKEYWVRRDALMAKIFPPRKDLGSCEGGSPRNEMEQ